jgi:hypothetical protein
LQGDVVLGHADLLGDFDDLNLDINLDKLLGERVDVYKSWVDGASETTELGNESDISLAYWLVGVGTAETAWDCTECTDDASKRVDLGGVRYVRIVA